MHYSHSAAALVTALIFTLSASSALAASSDQFILVGEGSLLSLETQNYYGVITYGKIESDLDSSRVVMAEAAKHFDDRCIGYMVNEVDLRVALIFDKSKVSSWPVAAPPALASATQQWASAGVQWNGRGPASLITTVNAGKGWVKWLSYAKSHLVAVPAMGEGSLLSQGNNTYYGVVQYKNVATSPEAVYETMLQAIIEAGDKCVGFHYKPVTGQRYLEAALLYDRSKTTSWPVAAPPSLSVATISYTSPASSSLWSGDAPVSLYATVSQNKGWNTWQSFAKADLVHNTLQYVGEGTLIASQTNKYFGVVQYKNVATNEKDLWLVMRRAVAECGDVCVGYHYRPVYGGQYLQAALLYDRSKTTAWPPASTPAALSGATKVWTSGTGALWQGAGMVSADASVSVGKGWNGWQCYAKTGLIA